MCRDAYSTIKSLCLWPVHLYRYNIPPEQNGQLIKPATCSNVRRYIVNCDHLVFILLPFLIFCFHKIFLLLVITQLHVFYFVYYVHATEGLSTAYHLIISSLQVHQRTVCPLIVQFLRQHTSFPPLAYAFHLFQREHYIINLSHAVSILKNIFNPVYNVSTVHVFIYIGCAV